MQGPLVCIVTQPKIAVAHDFIRVMGTRNLTEVMRICMGKRNLTDNVYMRVCMGKRNLTDEVMRICMGKENLALESH